MKRLNFVKSHRKAQDTRRASDSSSIAATPRADTGFDLERGRTFDQLQVPSTTGSGSHRSRSASPSPTPALGLHAVHQPEKATADIIFVHGLGGHCYRTWTKNHDSAAFWPGNWLPLEPEIQAARILTFGYNAKWRGATKSISTVTDFAKELLFEMRFAKAPDGADLNIGEKPIIFVVHSMGGLVVKKAYILGLHDENYKSMVNSISAVIFLSTPHRGSHLAEALNRIVSATFQSSKSFISDLQKSSVIIEELNEQFRHLAPALSIWSFYETLATSIGPRKLMVLEKDSSILGYPAEISKPLQADHNSVCKYTGPMDSNYVSVRNAIQSLVRSLKSKVIRDASPPRNKVDIEGLFQDSVTCDDYLASLRRVWITGTCDWFLQQSEVKSWLSSSQASHVLWYAAPPANGKSILASFIINYLQEAGKLCQYFFFQDSDRRKRSVANAFKSIAMQLAQSSPSFTAALKTASRESLGLEQGDHLLIWRNLFERTLLEVDETEPVYWIIDGLDECDSAKALIRCLKSISTTVTKVKILVLSRSTESISIELDRLSKVLPVSRIERSGIDHSQRDIEIMIDREVQHIRGTDASRQELKEKLKKRAEGNFLWTKLVLEEIMECHTEEGIREVLEEVPTDMTELYMRMEQNLVASTRKSNIPLIRALLEWTICAQRPLSLKELSEALQPEFAGILDLHRTVKEACGQFIHVTENGTVTTLHHTVREYFTRSTSSKFYIDSKHTHGKLFARLTETLGNSDIQWSLKSGHTSESDIPPFIAYAATNWQFHLAESHSTSSEHLDTLVHFFHGPAILTWIHLLGLFCRQEILVKASKALAAFTSDMKKRNVNRNPMLHRLSDLELLDLWSVDLIKIVGKFGRYLQSTPMVIYNVIPALCPPASIISRQFYEKKSALIKLEGIEDAEWTDHLGRFNLPDGAEALEIVCAAKTLAVLSSNDTVFIWNTSKFVENTSIKHGEAVVKITLSDSGTKLAIYGLHTTKVYELATGNVLSSVKSPENSRAMDLKFAAGDTKILAGCDDNSVLSCGLNDQEPSWQPVHTGLLKGSDKNQGIVSNSPICVSFNADKSMICASYRSAPLSVWRLSDGRCVGHCLEQHSQSHSLQQNYPSWFAVDTFTWNPITSHILGIYRGGAVFKWHPLTNDIQASHRTADEISASPNGKLFVTSSSDGCVRLWNFSYFTVIYQLSSEDLVTGLAFSPDSRRFYDIRGDFVNTWEPNSLTRLSDGDEHVSDTNSEHHSLTSVSKISEGHVQVFEAVTALAVSPDNSAYCIGFADGRVMLQQGRQSDERELLRFFNFLDIRHLSWSPDGKRLAAVDLAGEIQIVAVGTKADEPADQPIVLSSLAGSDEEQNISDILLHSEGDYLFCLDEENLSLMSYNVNSGSIATTLAQSSATRRRWLNHPTRKDIVLGYGAENIVSYNWETMQYLGTTQYLQQQSSASPNTPSGSGSVAVTKVVFGHDKKHTLVCIGNNDRVAPSVILFCSNDSWARAEDHKSLPEKITTAAIDEEVTSQVFITLGILFDSTFAFFDSDLWFCTISLTGSKKEIKRHYFIPRDWLGSASVSQCAVGGDGTLFWPRDGRVVQIRVNFGASEAF